MLCSILCRALGRSGISLRATPRVIEIKVESLLLIKITSLQTYEYLHLLAMLNKNGGWHTRVTTMYFKDEMPRGLQGPVLFPIVCSFHPINVFYDLSVRFVVRLSRLQFDTIFLAFGLTLAYLSLHMHVCKPTILPGSKMSRGQCTIIWKTHNIPNRYTIHDILLPRK